MRGWISAGACLLAFVAPIVPAIADDAVQGWSVTYAKDTFSGSVSPQASVKEAGTEMSPASLTYYCYNGSPAFVFGSGHLTFLTNANTVMMKSSDGKIVSFGYPVETKPAITSEIKPMFLTSADGVAFKASDGAQGVLPSIGAAQVLPIVDAACHK